MINDLKDYRALQLYLKNIFKKNTQKQNQPRVSKVSGRTDPLVESEPAVRGSACILQNAGLGPGLPHGQQLGGHTHSPAAHPPAPRGH